jgi:hypothetical protein
MDLKFTFTRSKQEDREQGLVMDRPLRIEPHVRSMIDGESRG